MENASSSAAKSLNQILDGSLTNRNTGSDFVSVMVAALQEDPVIISKRQNVASKAASISSTEAQRLSSFSTSTVELKMSRIIRKAWPSP